jgi:hypothetical protein
MFTNQLDCKHPYLNLIVYAPGSVISAAQHGDCLKPAKKRFVLRVFPDKLCRCTHAFNYRLERGLITIQWNSMRFLQP